jgi:ribosomal protein L40E
MNLQLIISLAGLIMSLICIVLLIIHVAKYHVHIKTSPPVSRTQRKMLSPFEISSNHKTNGNWGCLRCGTINTKEADACIKCSVKRNEES